MAAKILIFCKSNRILPIGVFWGAESESETKIAKFKMVDPIWRPKFNFIQIEQYFDYRGFLGCWVQIKRSKLQNSKLWIQYGGQNFRFSQIRKYFTYGIFRSTEFDSDVKVANFKMATNISALYKSGNIFRKLIYLKLFIWRCMYRGFLWRWAWIRGQKWEIQNLGSNMAVNFILFHKLIGIMWKCAKNPAWISRVGIPAEKRAEIFPEEKIEKFSCRNSCRKTCKKWYTKIPA